MPTQDRINYLEYPARDLTAVKQFFIAAFGWKFTDYGTDYVAFDEPNGISGGFYRADKNSNADSGATLTVFFSNDLEASQQRVVNAGGTISTPAFYFPGGRRFHFLDPNSNEFAVWSEK